MIYYKRIEGEIMGTSKTIKIISNAVYIIGVAIALSLGITILFGSNEAINPDAMLPFTWKEQAFMGLAFGTVPMLLACMAVYKFNEIKNSVHKKRNFVLVFFPGFICSACALFIIGIIVAGMINSFILH
jgi:hypothetical protein